MTFGLFILRAALGGALVLQGLAKATRAGRADTAAFFDEVGFRPAGPFVAITAATEIGAGILLVAGFGTWLATAGAIGVLAGAAAVQSRNGYWNATGGAEYPLVAAFVAAAIACTGPGRFSVDAVFEWSTPAPTTSLAALGLAAASVAPMLLRRRQVLRARAVSVPPAYDRAA